jgi:hypothetical protein
MRPPRRSSSRARERYRWSTLHADPVAPASRPTWLILCSMRTALTLMWAELNRKRLELLQQFLRRSARRRPRQYAASGDRSSNAPSSRARPGSSACAVGLTRSAASRARCRCARAGRGAARSLARAVGGFVVTHRHRILEVAMRGVCRRLGWRDGRERCARTRTDPVVIERTSRLFRRPHPQGAPPSSSAHRAADDPRARSSTSRTAVGFGLQVPAAAAGARRSASSRL